MPEFGVDLWQVDIEKMYEGEYWTNRYTLLQPSFAAAVTAAGPLIEAERAMHGAMVLFTKARVSDNVPNTDVYQIININAFGAAGDRGSPLPLFNVLRVDFTTVGGGRPSRKYYRLPMTEGLQENGKILDASLVVLNNMANNVRTSGGLVDVDGQSFSAASCYPFVGMRQLRRRSKRKTPATNPTPL